MTNLCVLCENYQTEYTDEGRYKYVTRCIRHRNPVFRKWSRIKFEGYGKRDCPSFKWNQKYIQETGIIKETI